MKSLQDLFNFPKQKLQQLVPGVRQLDEDSIYQTRRRVVGEMTVTRDGEKVWLNKVGEIHRNNGPAIERPDGTKEWWHFGRRRREDGPAVEHPTALRSGTATASFTTTTAPPSFVVTATSTGGTMASWIATMAPPSSGPTPEKVVP
jgi:hypothetical protein